MTYENLFAWNPADPPVATPPASVLAQMATKTLSLPVPGVQTSPPAGSEALVNMAIWLHVDNWACGVGVGVGGWADGDGHRGPGSGRLEHGRGRGDLRRSRFGL